MRTAHSSGDRHRHANVFFAFGGASNYQYPSLFPLDPDMSINKPTLDDLRRQIDAIDDQLHDLIMRRTEVVEAVGKEKKDGKVPAFRPGREAIILRRLVARHGGHFPAIALVRMWREMLAATVGMQADFAVAVYAPRAASSYWDLARDHFGSHASMTAYDSIGQVFRAISDQQASIGILPMPSEDDADPWWRFLVSNDATTPRVLARLPFAGRGNARPGGDALAIGSGALEPTDADRSLIVIETSAEVSRARLFSALSASGLTCNFFAAFDPGGGVKLNLLELTDFVLLDDKRLAVVSEQVGAAVDRILSLGSYAAPLALDAPADRRPTDMRATDMRASARQRAAAHRKPRS
jgi:chorismate mutase/prephenate dehydratase